MSDNFENNAINPNNGNGVNNKTNTFNLVIGIATLLIAILGATFAYFSATARSRENDVTVKSAYVSISYDGGTEIVANNLIPATQEVALSKYKKVMEPYEPGEDGYIVIDDLYKTEQLDRRCIDAKGKQVCYVYQFSVMSDGPVGSTTDIVAYIKVNQNEFDNLSYVLYEVEFETKDISGTDTGDGTVSTATEVLKDKYGTSIVKENGYSLVSNFDNLDGTVGTIGFEKFEKPSEVFAEDGSSQGMMYPVACVFSKSADYDTLDKNDSARCKPYSITNKVNHVYQLVVWLNETGEEQEEQGMTFQGTVVIEVSGGLDTSEYGNGQITGQE